MVRLPWLAAAGLALACSKDTAPAKAPATAASEATPPIAARPAPQPTPPMPPEPPKLVKIDDATVKRFIEFDKKYLAGLPPRMQAMRDELRKLEGADKAKGVPWRPGSSDGARDVLERMKAEDKRLREAAGLTEEQAQTVQELAMTLSALRKDKGDIAKVRQRFGNESVDAALRHEKELVALWDMHMKTFQDAMRLMLKR